MSRTIGSPLKTLDGERQPRDRTGSRVRDRSVEPAPPGLWVSICGRLGAARSTRPSGGEMTQVRKRADGGCRSHPGWTSRNPDKWLPTGDALVLESERITGLHIASEVPGDHTLVRDEIFAGGLHEGSPKGSQRPWDRQVGERKCE